MLVAKMHVSAKQKLKPSHFHLYSIWIPNACPEKCWSKGDGSYVFCETPHCSLVWMVSLEASYGHDPDKYQHSLLNITCVAPVAFSYRHLSREVPMVGSMMLILQVSLLKVFCTHTRYTEKKTPRWIGSGGGYCHCSKWKEVVACRRDEIMRLKEIGKKEKCNAFNRRYAIGILLTEWSNKRAK